MELLHLIIKYRFCIFFRAYKKVNLLFCEYDKLIPINFFYHESIVLQIHQVGLYQVRNHMKISVCDDRSRMHICSKIDVTNWMIICMQKIRMKY